jgi:hypothetical protein
VASAWPFWAIWFWFYVGVFIYLMAKDGILEVHELAIREIQR